MRREEAKNNVINSLVKDGFEVIDENQNVTRDFLSEEEARELVEEGVYSDWVNDETDYLNSL